MDVVTIGPKEIRSIVSMPDAMQAVRDSFLALARGEFEMPTRTSLRDGSFLVMSAHHRPSTSAMIKTLSLNFDNRNPAIVGTVVWSELGHTSHVVADAAEVTRIRTGAIVGVATDVMAPPNARSCTIIGAGGQAADQIRTVHVARPLSSVTIVDADCSRAESLAEKLAQEMPHTKFGTSSDSEKAITGADIVCCATTATAPLFRLEALSETVHVNAIGAFRPTMRELPDELLADAIVVIDEREAILEEAGEVIHALQIGAITEDALTELGTVLAAGLPERTARTVFKTVGVAVQDWAIAALLARHCLTQAR
ncbi:ornithine cyclodeaminase family protein [Streptomyces sp. NPDC090442]|uniref:ornithine cyclodeaminase family protein n=1 Tax=Streptomyces sp. NPDC090442 TaxID=3365962 RepID=UPI00382D670D